MNRSSLGDRGDTIATSSGVELFRERIRDLLVLCASVLVCITLTGSTSASAAVGDGGDGEIDIVLLGDSFSAGNGAGSYLPGSGCHRSTTNRAERYANMLRADGYEVPEIENEACSGAVTDHLGEGDGTGQMAAVDAGTDLVFLTIGGNDVDFNKIVASCFLIRGPLDTDIGWFPPTWVFDNWAVDMLKPLWCQSQISQAARLAGPGSDLEVDVVDVLRDLKAQGLRDDAQVVLLAYPYLELGDDYFEWYPVGQQIQALGDLGDIAQQAAVDAANAASTSGAYVLFNDTIKDQFSFSVPVGGSELFLDWLSCFSYHGVALVYPDGSESVIG